MTDILVIGGAATGSATAYHLLVADPSVSVTVLEKDPSLARSSTLLSDGNVRVQFNLEENIRISQYAMEVLDTFGETMAVDGFRPEVSMRRQGNLFLVDTEGLAAAHEGLDRQQQLGCDVKWMDQSEIEDLYPPLASDRFLGGTFGPDDGSVDPSAVTSGYRRAAVSRGATYEDVEVVGLVAGPDGIEGVRLSDGSTRRSDVVVICAGAWSTELLASIEIEIPVEPIMRTVYVVNSDVGKDAVMPSVFMPSGLYVIPEHDGTYLISWSLPDDPTGFVFEPADRSRFYDIIWPELVESLPAFDRLEVVRSWAGLYAQNTVDSNALVGEWPEMKGLYVAAGFSGHGFQQCHAVGRYLAELITGAQPFMDLSRLGPHGFSTVSNSMNTWAG